MRIVASIRRLAANRALGALVLANGISAIGDWLYLTVVPVLVYRETEEKFPTSCRKAASSKNVPNY